MSDVYVFPSIIILPKEYEFIKTITSVIIFKQLTVYNPISTTAKKIDNTRVKCISKRKFLVNICPIFTIYSSKSNPPKRVFDGICRSARLPLQFVILSPSFMDPDGSVAVPEHISYSSHFKSSSNIF